MKTISVALGKRSYPIWVEQGLLKKITDLLNSMNTGNQWVIVTQESIQTHYGNALLQQLKDVGFNAELVTIPTGEEAKSIREFEKLQRKLLELGCDRKTILIALGGGVVGDASGFAAATFMRGIDYIQIPTTLLAMIDSSIGGKTGINLPDGKNLIGAFHQPKAVVVDPEVLSTLPERETVSAMGEMLKYGSITDSDFFNWLVENLDSIINNRDMNVLQSAIIKSAEIKADIVARDEMESGLRKILNFGHTIGHALETVLGFGTILHGEAVAYGMIAAGHLSMQKTNFSSEDCERLETAIRNLPLPKLNDLNMKSIIETMKRDKKVQDGKIHFVLLEEIGEPVIIDNIDETDIQNALEIL